MPLQTPDQRQRALTDAGLTSANLAPSATPTLTPTTPLPPVPIVPPPTVQPTTSQPSDNDDFFSKIEGLQSQFLGKEATASSRSAQATSVPEKQLNEINKQIAFHQANSIAGQEEIRRSGGDVSFQSGEMQKRSRTDAIEALKLTAQANYLQGSVQLADEQARAAVDAEFALKEQELSAARQNIIKNYDSFSAAEKKRADATLLSIDKDDAFVAQAKEDRSYANSIALMAAQSGAPAGVIRKMRETSPDEAVAIGASFLGADFKQKAEQRAFENGIALRTLAVAEANAGLTRKKNLIDLAKEGDVEAISELGYDPNNIPLTPEKLKNYEDQKAFFNRDIEIAKRASGNWVGLEASSGLIRGGVAGAFLESPLGPLSAPYSAAKKNDFLADAGYIVKNLTFDKIKELSDKGIKLTPISEKELKAMGDASSVLVSSAEFDDNGNLKGFRISEDRVRQHLTEIETHYQNAIDDINVNMLLTSAERKELLGL